MYSWGRILVASPPALGLFEGEARGLTPAALLARLKDRVPAGCRFPADDDDVHVPWIQLHCKAAALGLVRGYHAGARSAKWVEHNITFEAAVPNRPHDEF